MNNSIGIALLLLFASAQFVSGVKRNPPSELEIREHVNELNTIRLEFAKKKQIANMHGVTWDQTLESKAKKKTCDELTSPGPDYVVIGFLEIFSDVLALQSKTEGGDLMKSPLFHPLQTKVACANLATKCDDETAVCLMGPKNSPVKQSEIKKGSPGTGCSGGDGASGLRMGGGRVIRGTPCRHTPLPDVRRRNSPVKRSEIKKGSPGTGCSGGDGASGLCMGGGRVVENVPAENQSDKKSGDGDVEAKGSKDGEVAASSA
ncbi:hypothetical protein CRE_20564 [Caenorhabditis remanei]|uniref:SCP domain-containing protein n=1 Tax=Caenorhabditis remanei TaxID=31234 RepID=E3NFD6_CAERE|nr:hypothetical protein CRE_20564 [Caenorhabditis remanei]